jgi:hypothetical protein
MPGRKLVDEAQMSAFPDFGSVRRRAVLRETISTFESARPPDRYHRLAASNLARWRAENKIVPTPFRPVVLSGDWGYVTQTLTERYGECFAVLNMANAYVPGGAYVEGAVAQEENMFRRTDCHFRIDLSEYDDTVDRYHPEMTRLLSGRDGLVYLDKKNPRVCIRGSEDLTAADLGYRWLPDDKVFSFFELRAAAQDLRDGSAFEVNEARRRIAAQLDTLGHHRVRHAVLGAFGCGAFRNPADQVARIYREEIGTRANDFDVIAFAIFAPGYGPDNCAPFAREFRSP